MKPISVTIKQSLNLTRIYRELTTCSITLFHDPMTLKPVKVTKTSMEVYNSVEIITTQSLKHLTHNYMVWEKASVKVFTKEGFHWSQTLIKCTDSFFLFFFLFFFSFFHASRASQKQKHHRFKTRCKFVQPPLPNLTTSHLPKYFIHLCRSVCFDRIT